MFNEGDGKISKPIIMKGDWEQRIQDSFTENNTMTTLLHTTRNNFLEMIWNMSQTAFDKPREVQVVIDSNDKLFMNFGTPSYVDFPVDMGSGMKLPLKCWIHTHPFGQAYFSGTDMSTIRTWEPVLLTAIVLGDNQHQIWTKHSDKMIHSTYTIQKLICNFTKQPYGPRTNREWAVDVEYLMEEE